MPNFSLQYKLVRFDGKVRDGLQAILNFDPQDGAWTQARKPVSAEGIGVRKSQGLSVSAFISSSHFSEMQFYAVLQKTSIVYRKQHVLLHGR